MFAFFLLGTTAALSVGIVVAVMRRAPEAYEDERGLTIIRNGPAKVAGSDHTILTASRSGGHIGDPGYISQPVRRRSGQQRQKTFSGKTKTFHIVPSFFHPHGKPAHARPAAL